MGYYQGDFYRGDPGFFSFLGGLAKKAVGFIPGVGPIAKGALDMIPTGGAKVISRPGTIATAGKAIVSKVKGGIVKHPVLSAAGAAGAVGIAGGATAAKLLSHHMGRRRKRMNPGNFRALRRSLRRISAFDRAARRVMHFTHPHRSLGKSVFKFKRRKKC